jgi:hypothetical protein
MNKVIKPNFEQLEDSLSDTATKIERTLETMGYKSIPISGAVKSNGAQHHTYQNESGRKLELIKSRRNFEIIKYWGDGTISAQGSISVALGYFLAYFRSDDGERTRDTQELEDIFKQVTRMTK